MPADQYLAQESPLSPGLTPLPSGAAPQATSLATTARMQQGAAIGGLGQQVVSVGEQIANAQQTTRSNAALTQALKGFSDLETQYNRDTDYQNAPQNFQKDADKLIGDTVSGAGLGPQAADDLTNRLQRLAITSHSAVTKAAFSREASANVASLSNQEIEFQGRYLRAGSDTERQSVYADQQSAVDANVKAGWITAETGQKTVQNFRANTEQAHAAALIASNPAAAQAALADPAQFPNMNPITRQNLVAQADTARDTQGQLQVGLEAKRDPAKAAAMVGWTRDPSMVEAIFKKGVIGQESGNDPNTPDSPAGAAGLTQMMPGTARMAADREGLTLFDGKSDEQVRQALRADPKLAYKLGLNEFSHLVDRYNGSIPAALAAYNAGPGNADLPRADAWHAQALQKFGPNYTADQFASLVPIAETKAYIPGVYSKLGAPTAGMGLSFNATMRAQTTVAAELQSQQSEQQQTTKQIAATARTGDPLTDILQAGYNVDPARLSAYRTTQVAAAAQGDATAAREVRRIDYAQAIAPMIQQAYAMPPAQLEQLVTSEQARLSNAPNVTGEEKDRLGALQAVLNTVNSQKGSNPVGLAQRAGLFRATPIPTGGDPGDPAFGQALRDRSFQATTAAQAYDGNLVPLMPDEASALKNQWTQAGPAGKVAMSAAFAANMGAPAAEAALKQVAGDDRMALTAGLVAQRDPVLGQKILEGEQLLETPGVKPKAADVREALRTTLGGQAYLSPQIQSDAIDAALAVYAAERGGKGALFDSSDRTGIEGALEQVAGKTISINGRKTPITPGYMPGAVSRGISNMTAEDFAPFGGLDPKLDPSWLASHAQITPLKLGGTEYLMTAGDRPVMTAEGRPMVIDLATVAAHQRARKLAGEWTASSAQDATDTIRGGEQMRGLAALP